MTTGADRYTMVQLLKERREAPAHFTENFSWLERHTSEKVKPVHTENGNECPSMRRMPSEIGIKLTASCTYSPESDKLAEWMNSTVLTKVIAIHMEKKVFKGVWEEALYDATDSYYRRATRTLKIRTP